LDDNELNMSRKTTTNATAEKITPYSIIMGADDACGSEAFAIMATWQKTWMSCTEILLRYQ
jgi:hypothetical protein